MKDAFEPFLNLEYWSTISLIFSASTLEPVWNKYFFKFFIVLLLTLAIAFVAALAGKDFNRLRYGSLK